MLLLFFGSQEGNTEKLDQMTTRPANHHRATSASSAAPSLRKIRMKEMEGEEDESSPQSKLQPKKKPAGCQE